MANDEPAIEPAAPVLPGRRLITWVVVALLIAALVSLYQHTSRKYPYYFIWDMDLSTAIDTVLIHSGKTPDHINHTAFGMYLVLSPAAGVGRRLELVSASTLGELLSALNPLACMAELTDYLRRLSPWVSLGTALCLWGALCLLLRCGRAAAVAALLVLASQECLYYHAAMVRTGLYSVFFWSAGVLALAAAARCRRQAYRLGWLFAGGALLGLSYMTKLQAMIYVAVAVMVFFLALAWRDAAAEKPLSRRQGVAVASLSGANLAVFALLLILSAREEIPYGKALFTLEFGMTKHAALMLVFLGGLCVLQWRLLSRKRTTARPFVLAAYLTMLLAGSLAAFALHLLMLPSLSLSWHYLLWDFKILFLRPLYTDFRDLLFYAERLWRLVGYCPVSFLVHVAGLAALGVAAYRKGIGERRRFYLCLASSGVLLLHVIIGVRFHQKDLIWLEPAMNLLSLAYWGRFLMQDVVPRRLRLEAAGGMMALLLVSNGMHLAAAGQRIDSNLHVYGFQATKWPRSVYGANQLDYRAVMKLRRPPSAAAARALQRQAADHEGVRQIVSFVFRSQPITLRHVGVLWEHLPVWADELAYTIEECPGWLRGSIVVDAGGVPPGRTGFLRPDEPSRFGEGRYEFAPPPGEPCIAVLPRSDLIVLLFLEARDFAEATASMKKEEIGLPPQVKLANGRDVRVLHGLPLPRYSVIPTRAIRGRFFLAVCSAFGPEPATRPSRRPATTTPATRASAGPATVTARSRPVPGRVPK